MRTVGGLIFPGFELLDLYGPLEMFGLLSDEFDLKLVSEHARPVRSNQQVSAFPDIEFNQDVFFDILLVPGGAGTRREVNNKSLIDWLASTSSRSKHVLSVCTGSALLAKAGLLDGRAATTNKAAFSWVCEQGPNVNWVREARWVEDDKFVTSSGVSAGIDMALGVISLLHGLETALKVATWSEYDWHRDKNWDPFAKVHGLV